MPLRTCISCRDKQEQIYLMRLQCKDKQLVKFNGIGRSFYICKSCLEDKKKLERALFRQCRNKAQYWEQLKEILANGR